MENKTEQKYIQRKTESKRPVYVAHAYQRYFYNYKIVGNNLAQANDKAVKIALNIIGKW